MGKPLIEINGSTSVKASDVIRVWVANAGQTYIKTADGETHPVDHGQHETPFAAKLRIEKLINEACA
jgi:hypothetical protein